MILPGLWVRPARIVEETKQEMTTTKIATNTTYGMHLTVRISNVERQSVLNDSDAVSNFLVSLVDRVGMRILAGPMVGIEEGVPEKRGLSSVIILYESHAAIHTYPELGEAFVDLFSCKRFSVETVLDTLESYFGSFSVAEQGVVDRGIHWGPDIEREMAAWNNRR
jgi:S-adenosylmethionine decarboxylase